MNMAGSGILLTLLTLFLVAARGLSVPAAAMLILVASLAGKVGATVFSNRVEAWGGRRTYTGTKCIAGFSMIGLWVAPRGIGVVVCLAVYWLASAVGGSARNLIIRDIGAESTVLFRAMLRSRANLGIVSGSVFASLLLLIDPRSASSLGILLNGLSCFLCAGIVSLGVFVSSLPPEPADSKRWSPPWAGWVKDQYLRNFLVLSAILGVIAPIISFVLPIWVTQVLRPGLSWILGILVAVNALVVILTQVRVGRWLDAKANATPALVLSAACVGLGCLSFAASAVAPMWVAVGFILVAVVVISLGEVYFAAGATEVLFSDRHSVSLARVSAQFNLASGVGEAVGPAILTAFVIGRSSIGWLILGTVYASLGVLIFARNKWRSELKAEAKIPTVGGT